MPEFEHDAFISHASEDKASFVELLANELRNLGLKIWYDKFSLQVGDSLHNSIELGLSTSSYGVVVFSPAFLAKNWPKAELNGLFAREMSGQKVILPVLHNISHSHLVKKLPIMGDKLALNSSAGAGSVAQSLVKVIRPELLAVRNSSQAAVAAGKRLADAVSRKHPGYDIRLVTGRSVPFENQNSRAEGIVASIYQGGSRADILITDRAALTDPPSMKLSFSSTGLEKLNEGVRTGKAQKLLPEEFRFQVEHCR